MSTWSLDLPLLSFPNAAPWTLRDACQHTQIFGAPGSGKTSGSGRQIALAFLRARFGGLVLAAKESEVGVWRTLAAETGRSGDIVVVDAAGSVPFNFMDYERRRPGGGEPGGIVDLLLEVHRITTRTDGVRSGSENETYFRQALERLLRNALYVATLSGDAVTLPAIERLISDSATSPEMVDDRSWRARSSLARALDSIAAREDSLNERERLAFEQARRYWEVDWPKLPDNTRESIRSTYQNISSLFLDPRYHHLFCGKTKVVPEMSHHGSIIVLALPPSTHGAFGRAAQVLFKYVWQQATLRRMRSDGKDDSLMRPVFLWIDESQDFLTSLDADFLNKGREARACVVYLSQGVTNYDAKIGRDQARALLNSMTTTVFHVLADSETIRLAQDRVGKTLRQRRSRTPPPLARNAEELHSLREQVTISESLEELLSVEDFHGLARGAEVDGLIEAFFVQAGRRWPPHGHPYHRWSLRRSRS